MKQLEERRTRLSLMVVLSNRSAQTGAITRDVVLTAEGSHKGPLCHRLGYWLFLDLVPSSQRILWNAKWYEPGRIQVDLDVLPRLRPLVEVQLTPRLKITTLALEQAQAHQSYLQTLGTIGGKAPLFFSSTALPPGLSLDSKRGAITGNPASAGQTNVMLAVSDSNGSRVEKEYTLKVVN